MAERSPLSRGGVDPAVCTVGAALAVIFVTPAV